MNGVEVINGKARWMEIVEEKANKFINEFCEENQVNGENKQKFSDMMSQEIEARFWSIGKLMTGLIVNTSFDYSVQNKLEEQTNDNLCNEIVKCKTFALSEFEDACMRAFSDARKQIVG